MSINTYNLHAHIDLVGSEFQTSSGVRAIAAFVGIAEGIDEPDTLYARCEQLIGYEANQEGYYGYDMDADGDLIEPRSDDQPFFGYGISISSHEAYLALFDHFGNDWLDGTLHAYFMKQTQGMTRPDAAKQVEIKVHTAKQNYVNAGMETYQTHQQKIADLLGQQRKVWDGFFRSLGIVAPGGSIKFVPA